MFQAFSHISAWRLVHGTSFSAVSMQSEFMLFFVFIFLSFVYTALYWRYTPHHYCVIQMSISTNWCLRHCESLFHTSSETQLSSTIHSCNSLHNKTHLYAFYIHINTHGNHYMNTAIEDEWDSWQCGKSFIHQQPWWWWFLWF